MAQNLLSVIYDTWNIGGALSSKKGIAATIGILGLITVASFVIWIVPQQNIQTQIIVSDYTQHLNDIDEQRRAIAEAASLQFSGVLDGSIAPQDHIDAARESSVIVKRQLADLLRSGADAPWHASYGMYVESLRSLDEYIGETVVVSKLVASGEEPRGLDRALAALAASEAYAVDSLAALP